MPFTDLVNRLAPVAVAGLWQGVAVVVAVAGCLLCARRMPATQRFALWGTGFLAALALPLAPALFFLIGSDHAPSMVSSPASHPWFQLSARWGYAIAAVWVAASLARTVDLAVHVVRMAGLWRNAVPVETAVSAGAIRGFEICRTAGLDRPSVIGFFRPRVLIPDWLLPKLTAEELEQIILHETTHLARRDDWTNLFQKLCLVLFPLNPARWWIDRQLAREREMACDEAVVHATQAPRAYAACLASLAERGMARRREALSLGAWHRRPEVVNRVHRILRAQRSLSPATARILLGAFGCGLAGGSIELARCPQLVAFVPTVRAVESARVINNASAQLGDAVFSTNPRREMLTPGAHVVQTRANMPSAHPAERSAQPARTQANTVGELRTSSETGNSANPTNSTMMLQPGAPGVDAGASQQYIVLTAWEEVESSDPASRAAVADYDAPSPEGGDAAESTDGVHTTATASAKGKPSVMQGQRHTSFTQLILRVVPSGTQPATPAAIPLGGGWFVIQL